MALTNPKVTRLRPQNLGNTDVIITRENDISTTRLIPASVYDSGGSKNRKSLELYLALADSLMEMLY